MSIRLGLGKGRTFELFAANHLLVKVPRIILSGKD
jgi:hypothetical protein